MFFLDASFAKTLRFLFLFFLFFFDDFENIHGNESRHAATNDTEENVPFPSKAGAVHEIDHRA